MPINQVELINAAEVVAQHRNMKVAFKKSAAGGAFIGASATIGSLLMGPVGLVFGAIAGSVPSYLYFKDGYKSLYQIIQEDLTPSQRDRLVWHLNNAVKDFGPSDLVWLATAVMSKEALFLAIADGLKNFVTQELHAQLQ